MTNGVEADRGMRGKSVPSFLSLWLLIFFFIADFGVKQMNAIFSGEMKTTAQLAAAAILPRIGVQG